jgi:signal transduction histidine kinase/CheY-like chemotaxis protein
MSEHHPSDAGSVASSAEERCRSLLEAVPCAVAEADAAGRVTACNERFAALFGRAAGELVGQVAASLPAEEGVRLEWRPLAGSGSLLVATPATDTAAAERERLAHDLQLQKLESLGVLAGGVAHDFNNALTVILGFTSLAGDEAARLGNGPDERAPLADYLGQVEQAARRAEELCRQMLAFSGRGRFVVRSLPPARLAAEAAERFRTSLPQRIILAVELAPDLPEVEADEGQLRQALQRLLHNAAEAIGERHGQITFKAGRRRCDRAFWRQTYLQEELPEGEYVSFEVTDDGCGMTAETQARVFEPFFSTKFTGRGLGLAAVLGVVRGHRGAVKVDSAPGRGSTFTLLLPRSRSAAAPAAVPRAAGGGLVLFVDDEPILRAFASLALQRGGFEVLLAADGEEALRLFRQRRAEVALVVLDLTMPRLGGVETLQELRRLDPGVKVLLSSGYSEAEPGPPPGENGDTFLPKPYRPQELLARVRGLIGSG